MQFKQNEFCLWNTPSLPWTNNLNFFSLYEPRELHCAQSHSLLTCPDNKGCCWLWCPRNKLVMYFHVQEVKAMQTEDPAFSPGLERKTLEVSTSCGSAPALLEGTILSHLSATCFACPWLLHSGFFFPSRMKTLWKQTNKQTNMWIINMFYSTSI